MNLMNVIFYTFSALLIFSACMVITARNPVHGVLFLVLGFFSSAGLWILLQAEFLSLVLIFVYVGAVMTLFLFVVMMLNLELASGYRGWVRHLPLGILAIGLLMILMVSVINSNYWNPVIYHGTQHTAEYSNTKALGEILYTKYAYPFELAAVLLLVAIIAAVSLAQRSPRESKTQRLMKQHEIRPRDRLRLISKTHLEKEEL